MSAYKKIKAIVFVIGIIFTTTNAYSQATFQSNAAGNWNASSSWTRTNGNDIDGIPDDNDYVTILNGDIIKQSSGGAIRVETLTIDAGGQLELLNANFTVDDATSISGKLIDNTSNGLNTFTGKVTVNNTGEFSSSTANTTSTYSFRGGIQNDGNFSLRGSGGIALTATQTINGSADMLFIGNVTISTGTITNSNAAAVTINGVLNGAVNGAIWTNGANSTLNYGNSTTLMNTGTLNASATGNMVNYSGGAQTIKNVTYYNLATSGNNTKSLAANATITGDITIGATTNLDVTASNYNISVAGSWTNNGTFTPRGSTVTFNGTVNPQVINGVTTYNHLIFSGAAIKALNSNIIVNGNITNNAATTLNAGVNSIEVNGNWTNNGTFNGGSGEVNFISTTSHQQITGATTFNNIKLSKASGFNLLLNNSITVSGLLSFVNQGLIVIGTNNLSFGPNASVSGAGAGKMIQQTGTSSGGSVIKQGTVASNFLFNFPIGTGTIFTPAQITSLSAVITGTGEVYVKPLFNSVVINNFLTRYYSIKATNINTAAGDVGLRFTYDDADELGTPNIVRRKAGGISNNASAGFVDLSANAYGTTPAGGNTVLESDWYLESSGPHHFYSYQNGNWTSSNTWTLDPTGAVLIGSPAAGGPTSLDQVTILTGKIVTMDVNSKTIAATILNAGAILDVGAYSNINLGTVSGTGSLRISALAGGTSVFPSGNYTNFLAPFGTGTVEYNSANSYFLGNAPAGYYHLILSGGGTKTLTSNTTDINGNITISAGTTFGTNSNNINLGGNWINNGTFTTNLGSFEEGEVNFNNTAANQTISGSSTTTFWRIRLSKAAGFNLILNRNTEIKGDLFFTNPSYVVLGTYNFIFKDGATVDANEHGAQGKMIQQNGSIGGGLVIKEGNDISDFSNFTFPIGTGNAFTPFTITSLNGNVAASSSISVRAVIIPPGQTKIINRYFSVTSIGITAITNAGLTFNYDQADEVGSPNQVRRRENGTPYSVTGYFYNLTTNKFGTNDNAGNTFLASDWYLDRPLVPEYYYSYQSGVWSDPNSWTTDPTGATLINSPNFGGPNGLDNVVILTGHTITMDQNNKTLTTVTISNGSALDILSTIGHNLGTVSGQGTLKISTTTIPAGTYTSFVSSLGGTFEYNNAADFTLPPGLATYNNLTINLATNTFIATQKQNLVINGNLLVSKGVFRINDATSVSPNPYTLTINKDIEVSSTGEIGVGTGNTHAQGATNVPAAYNTYNNMYHRIYVYGNMINNGKIRLTNQGAPVYNQNAEEAASVFFMGSTNTSATLNNTTDFYNLIVDKGSDRTFIFTVNASNEANFRLFGRNNLPGRGQTAAGVKDPNPEIRKAVWIKNGTLRLTGQINIPTLTEGGGSGPDDIRDPNGDYFVPSNGALWLDGAGVKVYSTADNAAQTSVGGATAGWVDTGTGTQAWSVYGLLKISSGYFDSRSSAGLIFWSAGSDAKMEISGGIVRLTQARAGDADGKVSFIQSGGDLYLEGAAYGEENDGSGILGFNADSHVFIMSGGNIFINDVNNTNAIASNAIQIGSSTANYSVTGGTITLNLRGTNNYGINSTANLHNLIINRTANSANVELSTNPLVLTGNLTIKSGTSLDAKDFNVSIKGNFYNNGTYSPGNNTTTFNGTNNNQELQLNTGSSTSFYNFTLNNTYTGGALTVSGTLASKTFNVTRQLSLTSGNLNDGGFILNVSGNVLNSVTHSGTGRIRMNNTGSGKTISGNGNGIFGNLELNDADDFTMLCNQGISNSLILTDGYLDISNYNLALGSNAVITVASPSVNKMIRTSGNRGDGGVSKIFTAATGAFVFPIGTPAGYTPFETNITASTTYGTVTVRAVDVRHPLLTIPPATTNDALNYYWRVTESNFSGVTAVNHRFTYQDPLIPAGQTDAGYVAAKYSTSNNIWQTQAYSTQNQNYFNYSSLLIEGEYTAGKLAAFGVVTVFESIKTGPWKTANTWRKLQNNVVVENPSTTLPGSTNPVKIMDNHIVTVAGTGAVYSGSLEIRTLGTLDIGSTMDGTGNDHNFGALIGENISGNGKLRISTGAATAKFPAGDFSNFIGINGGTVEYYRSSANFTLPIASVAPTALPLSSYYNLLITPSGGTISMPNLNLNIYNDLTIAGTASSIVNISSSTSGNLNIVRDLSVSGGATLRFQNAIARTIDVARNVTIGTGSSFTTLTSGTTVANMVNISGDLINDGTLDFLVTNSKYANVTFIGNSNNTLSGNGGTTDFNRLILNKGTGQVSTLEVTSSAFSLSASNEGPVKSLDLQNGIFKYNTPVAVTLSSGNNIASNDYYIPPTAQLWINSGTVNISSTGTNAGLILGGKLKVSGGLMSIAGGGNNNNYLEVAGAGNPSIEMLGGILNVGSQIRRSTSVGTGSLTYNQSGGTVNVGTQSQGSALRGMFEVVNAGSSFNMSGGNLVIVRSNNSVSVASLELSPSTYSVTGGTVEIGGSATPASQAMLINSQIPLFNFTVNNNNSPVARLYVQGLIAKGNVSILGGQLNANNLDINIGGNFINNSTYTPGINTTTFDGLAGHQTIGGTTATVFNVLTVNNTHSNGTVTLNGANVSLSSDLNILSGTLDDNGRTITATKNIYNSANHKSGPGGKLLLSGTSQQVIDGSGSGTLGNVELNNSNGFLALTSFSINGNLNMILGLLDIDDNNLNMGPLSSITGTFSSTRMIKTNGLLSDLGVTKSFESGAFDFTFPVGVLSKYTPARFTATTNTAPGSITLKPVNERHPSTTDLGNTELNYYWNVESGGFYNLNVRHFYTYNQTDANGNGNENNYQAARLVTVPSPTWIVGTATLGFNNATTNTITINGGTSNPGVNYLTGDYTAGELAEFSSLVPYVSNGTGGGLWNVASSWQGGVVPESGAIVTIQNGDNITIPGGVSGLMNLLTRQLNLSPNSRLNLQDTYGHNFGSISGKGTIVLSIGTFPAGSVTNFVNSNGGTVEYTGTGYTIANMNQYNNLIINSSGSLNMAGNNIIVNGNLKISTGVLNNPNNRNIDLKGTWWNNGAFSAGTGTLILNGALNQAIKGRSSTTLGSVKISKTGGFVSLDTLISITGNLNLVWGKLVASSATDKVTFYDNATSDPGNANSFIDAKVSKIGNDEFTFPVGDGNHWARLRMFDFFNYDVNTEFSCQYFAASPSNRSSIYNNSLERVSGVEYWDLSRVLDTGSDAECRVRLHWENENRSGISGLSDPNTLTDLTVAHFSSLNNQWENIGGSGTVIGLAGYISSMVRLKNFSPITFGSDPSLLGEDLNPLPVIFEFLNVKSIKDLVRLEWRVNSSEVGVFIIERSSDGINFEKIGEIETSNSKGSYKFDDSKPITGLSYYRILFQSDKILKYSSLEFVDRRINNNSFIESIYPNPSNGKFLLVKSFLKNRSFTVSVSDLKNMTVKHPVTLTSDLDGNFEINDLNLNTGFYLLKIYTGELVRVEKIIVE